MIEITPLGSFDGDGVARSFREGWSVQHAFNHEVATLIGSLAMLDDHMGEAIAYYWGIPRERVGAFCDSVMVRFDFSVKRELVAEIAKEVLPECADAFSPNGPAAKLQTLRNTLSHGWVVGNSPNDWTVTLRIGRRGSGYQERELAVDYIRRAHGASEWVVGYLLVLIGRLPGWEGTCLTLDDLATWGDDAPVAGQDF